MIDKNKTVKEICNVPDSLWSEEDYKTSPFPAWEDALMKKTYEEVNLFDVTRMIIQRVFLEVALPKAIDFLNEDPYTGEGWPGELLEQLSKLKYSDVIKYKDDFDKILDDANNNLDSFECDFEYERDDIRKIIEMFDYEKIKKNNGKSKNINREKRKNRYQNLEANVYQELIKNQKEKYKLLKIKTNKRNPKKGDVFLINPKPGLYFWGLIIEEYIIETDNNHVFVILIFKEKIEKFKKIDYYIDLHNLLLEPMLVSSNFWDKGYFYTISNIDLSNVEVDFGFYKILEDVYLDRKLNVVENHPVLIVTEAVYNEELFIKYIHEELIIDKSLAQCDETLKLI